VTSSAPGNTAAPAPIALIRSRREPAHDASLSKTEVTLIQWTHRGCGIEISAPPDRSRLPKNIPKLHGRSSCLALIFTTQGMETSFLSRKLSGKLFRDQLSNGRSGRI
jgi:hypothetical protein